MRSPRRTLLSSLMSSPTRRGWFHSIQKFLGQIVRQGIIRSNGHTSPPQKILLTKTQNLTATHVKQLLNVLTSILLVGGLRKTTGSLKNGPTFDNSYTGQS